MRDGRPRAGLMALLESSDNARDCAVAEHCANGTGEVSVLRSTGVVVVCLLLVACAVRGGADRAHREHGLYNEMVRLSEDEQLLTNIVRMRYNDTPRFLDLNSVVVQYAIEGSASAGLGFGINRLFGSAGPAAGGGSVGTGITLSERPTVSYQPLHGEAYVRRLLTPIPAEVIWLLANSGWSVERLLRLSVERIGDVLNAPTASGPQPLQAPEYSGFLELAATARRLQQAQVLTLASQRELEQSTHSLTLRIDRERAADLAGDIDRLLQVLAIPAGAESIVLNAWDEERRQVRTPLRPRSLLGVLYFVANTIQPPPAHVDAGLVRVARHADGSAFDWSALGAGLIEIRSSASPPAQASIAIHYRDHWFYIDDRDADSKASFSLLQLLYSLQAGGGDGRMPLLTLPAG